MTSAAASLLALSDPNRLLLLRLLLEEPLTVGELTDTTGLGQSLVSHHLGVLARTGWLAARADGRRRVYSPAVAGTPLAPLAAWLRREIALPGGMPEALVAPVARRPSPALEDWLL